MKIHSSITQDTILDAVRRQMSTLDNPGFCIACGQESMSCEPDAIRHQCESCGEHTVYGAQELMFHTIA